MSDISEHTPSDFKKTLLSISDLSEEDIILLKLLLNETDIKNMSTKIRALLHLYENASARKKVLSKDLAQIDFRISDLFQKIEKEITNNQ